MAEEKKKELQAQHRWFSDSVQVPTTQLALEKVDNTVTTFCTGSNGTRV